MSRLLGGEERAMDDAEIFARIDELAEEEHRLERSKVGEGLSEAELARLNEIEVALDRAWDLLRQRRARRHAGEDPNEVDERPTEVVESYLQ
jgi:hypothetical protein